MIIRIGVRILVQTTYWVCIAAAAYPADAKADAGARIPEIGAENCKRSGRNPQPTLNYEVSDRAEQERGAERCAFARFPRFPASFSFARREKRRVFAPSVIGPPFLCRVGAGIVCIRREVFVWAEDFIVFVQLLSSEMAVQGEKLDEITSHKLRIRPGWLSEGAIRRSIVGSPVRA